jgi:hypothetical protein
MVDIPHIIKNLNFSIRIKTFYAFRKINSKEFDTALAEDKI